MFGADDVGSTGIEDACNHKYRGPEPLSEPETQAVADFVTKWSNLKVAVSLHAYGNNMILPFNYDTDAGNTQLKEKFPLAEQFFSHLFKNGGFPEGCRVGNA